MKKKMTLPEIREKMINTISELRDLDYEISSKNKQLGKTDQVLRLDVAEGDAEHAIDEQVAITITTRSGIKLELLMSEEIAKKIIASMNSAMDVIGDTNIGEESMYTILDPDGCEFTSGTLEELKEQIADRDMENNDFSDWTIHELKLGKSFDFDSEDGVRIHNSW